MQVHKLTLQPLPTGPIYLVHCISTICYISTKVQWKLVVMHCKVTLGTLVYTSYLPYMSRTFYPRRIVYTMFINVTPQRTTILRTQDPGSGTVVHKRILMLFPFEEDNGFHNYYP